MQKTLQIVIFDNPCPPDYGGVIDVFYKIKALKALGVRLILHVFYSERNQFTALEQWCDILYTYKRNKSFLQHFSILPYAVKSRSSEQLLTQLNNSDAPILFESLVSTSVLNSSKLKQQKLVRAHNIEHHYSKGLFKSAQNYIQKTAFYIESLKLKRYESVLDNADVILSLSDFETEYFKQHYTTSVKYLKIFQEHSKVISEEGNGTYALYHGDLTIADNIKSALFLIDVFSELEHPLIIAGRIIPDSITQKVSGFNHIKCEIIKDQSHLNQLIKEAHINTLYSFQKSGTKLKVFTALFKGKHCIVNKNMIDDANILSCCELAETLVAYRVTVNRLFQTDFKIATTRIKALESYHPENLAKQLVELIN